MAVKLRGRRDILENFRNQEFQGKILLQAHTRLADSFIISCFQDCQEPGRDMALVALGGYGRKELFPYSDIDLLLLYDRQQEKYLDKVVEAVLYPLWDSGLEVGHSVRTMEDCLEAAGRDYFFRVALLDARFLAGSERLFEELDSRFRKAFIERGRRGFLEDMLYHRGKRHEKFGLHSYMLEPQIKESRGGLRDIQAMMWVARVIFSLYGLKDMEDAGLLSCGERSSFEEAWNYLVRIRNHLHCQSGRKNDQLYFEHQEEMARALGYQDGDSLLAVEHFMREVHNRMQRVAVTTDLFFEYVEEVVGRTLPGAASRSREIVLEKGIIARQGRIHLAESAALAEKPYLLMRLFALAARRNLAIHHRTRKIIRENLSLITERLRKSGRLARNFLEVLHSPESCPVLLPTMLETGLLSAYLPEFAGVESLSFHNVYHIYTVDRHLVQTVLELGRLKGAEEKILSRISSPSVLYLAALLHDIGKGQGSGHSERGAVLAAQICFRLGLSKKEVSILSFLIRNHLFLAEIAMRRDLEDENLILSCARIVGTSERLDLLYLLIIADSRATGPNAWSRWKAALVQELYLKILHVLEQGDPVMMEADQDTAEDWMRSQVAALLGPESGVDAARIPADYLLSFTVREIERHVDLIAGMADRRVIVEPDRHSGHWSLLLITGDRPGLLARIFGVLTLNNLEVLNARVCTWSNGTVVDVLQIRSSIGNTYDDQDWGRLEEQLNLAVSHRLGLEYRLNGRSIETRRLKVPRQSRDKVEVRVDNEGSERFTIIEIFADRRFGLLYDITRTLSDFCLNIFRAKISTSGDQMVEVFYVQDEQGSKLRDKELVREVRNSLLHVAT